MSSVIYVEDQALASGPTYGLDLALRTHQKVVKTRADLVVVWLHWCLLRNGFQNHGGELTHSEVHAESLPVNLCWNGDKQAYVLKYEFGGVPIALGVYMDRQVPDICNISFVGLNRTLKTLLSVSDLVGDDFQIKGKAVDDLTKRIDDDFVKPMVPPKLVRKKRSTGPVWESRRGSSQAADEATGATDDRRTNPGPPRESGKADGGPDGDPDQETDPDIPALDL